MPWMEAKMSVTSDSPPRADLCVQRMTQRSRADVRGLFAQGCVRLNGETCLEPGARVAAGDELYVRHDTHRRYRDRPSERPSSAFRLVYEDRHILVVDKAAHVLTQPTDRRERNTLIEAVTRRLRRRNPRARPVLVHRLDRGTSGLLVVAVTNEAAAALRQQFRVRKAEREYIAIVAGIVSNDRGRFDTHLATTRSLQRYSVSAGETGERAVTNYEVLERLRGATVVRARLETGRRHQIRVQFAEAGHPVLGDERYGAESSQAGWKALRLALHAVRLGFDHPATLAPLSFESPWPEELLQFVAQRRPSE
jgi:23S rRNA pseudouridine1911/1915/1917 synthase